MTLENTVQRKVQERRNFWRFSGSLLLLLGDAIALTLAGILSIFIRFSDHVKSPKVPIFHHIFTYDAILVSISILWISFFVLTGAYSPYIQIQTYQKDKILLRNSLWFIFSIGFFFYISHVSFSRVIFGFYSIITIVLLFFIRFLLNTLVFRSWRNRRQFTRGLLLIGTDIDAANRYRKWVDDNPDYGYHIADICILSESVTELTPYLSYLMEGERPTDALILSSTGANFSLPDLVDYLSSFPIRVHVVPLLVEQGGYFNFLVREEDSPFFSLSSSRLNYVNSAIKRAFDIVFSVIFLLVFSWIYLVIALAVKLSDGGPVFYQSQRVGIDGKVFWFLKFRSMVPDAEVLKHSVPNKHGDEHVLFKNPEDPRITKLGRILRRYSLDELPQFVNVLKGEMSVVGPRPALPEEVARYSQLGLRRLDVKPGITGPWQVSGRADLAWDKSLLLDLNYSVKWSFWGDLWIIIRTLGTMISGRGAY